MSGDLGEVRQFVNAAEAFKQGFAVTVSKEDAEMLAGMTPKEQSEWMSKQVNVQAVRAPNMTNEEILTPQRAREFLKLEPEWTTPGFRQKPQLSSPPRRFKVRPKKRR